MRSNIAFISLIVLLTACASQNTSCNKTSNSLPLINQKNLLSDLKIISSDKMLGRKTSTKGNLLSQQYITKRYFEIGLEKYSNNFYSSFDYPSNQSKQGNNLIGYLVGIEKPDQYLVITAHYDHIGFSGNKIFNGADDNASGVAGMLAIADYFIRLKPKHSIIFVATDAEENGLHGSKAFIRKPPIPLSKIKYNINLDMIGRGGKKNRLYIAGTRKNKTLKKLIFAKDETYSICLKAGHDRKVRLKRNASENIDWPNSSDHASFIDAKIPYLFFNDSPHKDYHKTTDTYEKINTEFFTASVETILDVILKLDNL